MADERHRTSANWVMRGASAAVITACLAPGLLGCASSLPSGPLFSSGEKDVVCAPVSSYRDASIEQPIETDLPGKVVVTSVRVGHLVNLSVSRAGIGRLRTLALLGVTRGPDAPSWSTYGDSFTVTASAPGQAVAAIHVIDPTKDATAGPFVVTYTLGGERYRSDAVLTYRVSVHGCS